MRTIFVWYLRQCESDFVCLYLVLGLTEIQFLLLGWEGQTLKPNLDSMTPIKAANQLDLSVLMKADMQCEQPQEEFAPVDHRLKFEDLFKGVSWQN